MSMVYWHDTRIIRVSYAYYTRIIRVSYAYRMLRYTRAVLYTKRNLQLRDRGHDYELPNIRTERFKRVFLNRRLFKLV